MTFWKFAKVFFMINSAIGMGAALATLSPFSFIFNAAVFVLWAKTEV